MTAADFASNDLESQILSGLNPQQREAVEHIGSPLLIIAGAGSGKTRVITHRIAYLSHVIGIPLWQILAVTFTNKAAREMRERIGRLLGHEQTHTLPIGTFHSRCALILRREADAAGIDRSFAIIDDRDQVTAVKKAMEAANLSEKRAKPAQCQHFINMAKMRLLTPAECKEAFDHDELPYADVYAEYEKLLHKNNSLDFEDLIFKTVLLLRDHEDVRRRWNEKYRYVLVDEFQDTNHSQFELVKLLVGEDRHICVVGDEDQSIYSWRGAEVTNLLDFNKTYPDAKLVRLEQNYRSVGNVLKAAETVIKNNTMRIGKSLWTEKEDGEVLRGIGGVDDTDEAEQVAGTIAGLIENDGIPPEEIAIFYRSHRLSRAFEDGLRKYRLPYRLVGSVRFYDRAEIKDVLSFLRLAVIPHNDLAFERVVNVPTRGVGKKTHGDIIRRAAFRGVSQFTATQQLLDEGEIKGKAKKGLESFIAMVTKWFTMAKTSTVREVLTQILKDTEYKETNFGDPDNLDARVKIENVEELENVVVQFEQEVQGEHTVTDFLEAMSLDGQRDEDDGKPKVSLMTVHNAKGLEFDYVFVVGLDQGLFPNSRTMDNPAQFEEERRLFYVALTRARQKLYLSRASRRLMYGAYDYTEPSVFLREIPDELLSDRDREKLGLRGMKGYGRGTATGQAAPAGRSYENRLFGARLGSDAANQAMASQRRPKSTFKPADKTPYSPGDRVEHKKFGQGTVLEVKGGFGAERVKVQFDEGYNLDLMVKFAPLTKVE
ncbi:MAG: UvrD-helicase domain-containing protein [Sumerlaeia bacterium]